MSHTLLLASSIAYNTRIVLLGTMLLGMCGGIVGAFMLLRKKALVSDVASHAALPGVCIAYLAVEAVTPGGGKSLPWLLTGASVTAGLGVVTATLIQKTRLIKEDAALGIVLSLYFGAGIVLLTIIQGLQSGSSAGLDQFIFGKTASMTLMDVYLIATASGIVLLICFALFKEFSLICFDEEYASVLGWPAKRLDLLLTVLVVGVTVIGMQSVGLLLVVALLVIPPSSARFWSDRLGPTVIIASVIGGLSALVGVLMSASFENLAAGPIIVLTGTLIFVISLLFGTRRGTVWNAWRRRIAIRRKGQLDLLRACYEQLEQQITASGTMNVPTDRSTIDLTPYPISRESLVDARSWSARRVNALLRSSVNEGWLRHDSEGQFRLTQEGTRRAAEAVRNHRLWELYLIHYADVALGRVDRDADLIEHALEPVIVEQLEALLKHDRSSSIPISPHG